MPDSQSTRKLRFPTMQEAQYQLYHEQLLVAEKNSKKSVLKPTNTGPVVPDAKSYR